MEVIDKGGGAKHHKNLSDNNANEKSGNVSVFH